MALSQIKGFWKKCEASSNFSFLELESQPEDPLDFPPLLRVAAPASNSSPETPESLTSTHTSPESPTLSTPSNSPPPYLVPPLPPNGWYPSPTLSPPSLSTPSLGTSPMHTCSSIQYQPSGINKLFPLQAVPNAKGKLTTVLDTLLFLGSL